MDRRIHRIKAGIFFVIFGAGLASLVGLAWPVGFTSVGQSFLVLFNQVFTLSEAAEAYVYNHFDVAVGVEMYGRYIFVAYGLMMLLVLGCVQFRVSIIGLMVAFFGLQIYFGFGPFWIFNGLVLVAGIFAIFPKASVAGVGIAGVVAVVVGLFFYTGPSDGLDQLNRDIRDFLGNPVYRTIFTDPPPPQFAYQIYQQDVDMYLDEGQLPQDDLDIEEEEIFAGSQIGAAVMQRIWILWLIGLAFLIGFIANGLYKIYLAHKRRKAQLATVDGTFQIAMAWLVEFGLVPVGGNVGYQQLTFADDGYQQQFAQAVDMWEQTVYGEEHPATMDGMMRFLQNTKALAATQCNPIVACRKKIKIFFADTKPT